MGRRRRPLVIAWGVSKSFHHPSVIFCGTPMLCAVQQQQLHDYDEACLHDTLAKTILVSQTIRRSMWMDVQLSCQTQDNEEESVSDSCHIVLKQGIQYGVVVAFEILYWHE
jgi:hypothetical protein